ncbi:hypothetical protein PPS11_27216 [Pseudomonas putida S11]|nr:hypothetical protein PPS11_27216 [Pseudomonas putida S11]
MLKRQDYLQYEIERLRLFAESLFGALSDCQLRVMAKVRGQDLPLLHKSHCLTIKNGRFKGLKAL